MINPHQKLHYDGFQIYTTFHGRPETVVAFEVDQAEGLLIDEVCRRFNQHSAMLAALEVIAALDYTALDSNDDEYEMLADAVSIAASALKQIEKTK